MPVLPDPRCVVPVAAAGIATATAHRRQALLLGLAAAASLAGCGGGGGSEAAAASTGSSSGTDSSSGSGSSGSSGSTATDTNGLGVAPATTTTVGAWRLETGANTDDSASSAALSLLRLVLALDSGTLSSGSSSLVVGAADGSGIPVTLDSSTVVRVVEDSLGWTVTATLPSGRNLELALTGSGNKTVTVYSDRDYRLSLEGVSIASADGPALNLQSEQRAHVLLVGSNTLSDSSSYSARSTPSGASMDLKACCFAEGPILLSGSGSLAVSAASKHALASDAHVRLSAGSLTLSAAKKDGLRANNAFVMDGGALTIATPAGKGIKVEGKESTTAAVGFIAINAGTLAITSHDKAITASWEGDEDGDTTTSADDPDPRVTINGGAITITTTGTPYEDTNTADGDSSLSPEGIEAKSTLTINGGTLVINSTDDALNAGKALVINGGFVYARASKNDAIDSNGTLSLTGGVVVANGASGAEGGLDCDSNAFTVTGGTFIGIGGRNSSVTASLATQNCVTLRSVSSGLLVLRDSSGRAAFAFTLPSAATAVLLGSPLLATGSSYTAVLGGTLAAGGTEFNGLVQNPGTHTGGTALSSSFTISARVTSL
ncbi:MAG: carbohydrate-binding domain-containing protein [Burkholderiaceae bacterium]|nr:carbohydrate-binding domain-containing protein [Burkholderiaceae bacterium]